MSLVPKTQNSIKSCNYFKHANCISFYRLYQLSDLSSSNAWVAKLFKKKNKLISLLVSSINELI